MNGFSSPALSAGAMAAIRILTLMAGPALIASGVAEADQVEGIVTGLVTIGVAGYGLVKTYKRQKRLNNAEAVLGRPIPAKL
jgi:uncharacterized membrane protein